MNYVNNLKLWKIHLSKYKEFYTEKQKLLKT